MSHAPQSKAGVIALDTLALALTLTLNARAQCCNNPLALML